MKKYRIYATLLDGFQNYLDSSETYQKYWGNSEDPTKTEEEFEQEQYQSLIDRINRVPLVSQPADRGSAFNELIDKMLNGEKFETDYESGMIYYPYKEEVFQFSSILCGEVVNYFKKAIPQHFVKADIETVYGTVELYGYIDMLLPDKVVDIKTTSKYSAFQYRKGWQHKVYPYCLNKTGINLTEFEYYVTDLRSIWIETYNYTEKDVLDIQNHLEQLIEFLEGNRDKITDKKIFV